MEMYKNNISLPEPVTFLELAVYAMEDYHSKHGRYPGNWHQLDFTFSYGPYYIDDGEVKPFLEDGNSWKPKGCDYRYVIESSDQNIFRIIAINKNNEIEFEIIEGMDSPKKIIEPSSNNTGEFKENQE